MSNNGNSEYGEYFVYEAVQTLAAGTGVTFSSLPTKIDAENDFVFNKTTYTATNDRIKIKLKDGSLGRYLWRESLDIKSIAGRNTLPMGMSNSHMPFIWPAPYRITAGAEVTLESADASSATNTFRLAFHGAKMMKGNPPWQSGNFLHIPFVYSLSGGPVTVTASSTATARIETDNDTSFLIQKITGIRTGAATVQITEGGRGRAWSNIPVHIDNLLGNGAFPNVLSAYRYLHPGTPLLCQLTDTSGAVNVIDICLIGTKLIPLR